MSRAGFLGFFGSAEIEDRHVSFAPRPLCFCRFQPSETAIEGKTFFVLQTVAEIVVHHEHDRRDCLAEARMLGTNPGIQTSGKYERRLVPERWDQEG